MNISTISRSLGRVGLVGAACALGAAGITYAAIPDSNNVIHACRGRALGVVRIIDTERGERCTRLEDPVEWNEQGPVGPIGPAGPAGRDGAVGPAGPSAPPAVVVSRNDGPVRVPFPDEVVVATVFLPAGSWSLVAKGVMGGVHSTCELRTNEGLRVDHVVIGFSTGQSIPYTLAGIVTLQSGEIVNLQCFGDGGVVVDNVLIATAVTPLSP
jgi:hypothetical protein